MHVPEILPPVQEFIPSAYQDKGTAFMLSQPAGALWFDTGLRKTATALDAFVKLKAEGKADRCVVIAPRRPAILVWPREIRKWDRFEHLRVEVLRGARREERFADPDVDVFVTTYDNLSWFSKTMHDDKIEPPDFWILDESTYTKRHNNTRFKILTGRRKRGTKPWPYPKLTKYFKRVWELTGTPTPHSYTDLWSQIYLLDGGERLFDYITQFREAYCWQNPHVLSQYKFIPEHADEVFDRVRDLVLRMDKDDWREVDAPVVVDMPYELPPKVRAQYEKLEKEFVLALDEEGDDFVVAGNAAGLLSKLRQVSTGGVYYEASTEWNEFVKVRKAEWLHDAALDTLYELVESLGGKPLIIFYQWRFEIEKIRERFGDVPNLSGMSDRELDDFLDAWNRGEILMVLAHAASCGHGLNLQEGGCHCCCWYGLTFDLELYLQANARLDRSGQGEQVMIYRLWPLATVMQRVSAALEVKYANQRTLLDAMRG